MNDETIINLFFERNEDAILYTSEKYGNHLRSLSNTIVKDIETAKECENDTYKEAWNLIPPNSPKEHFFAFLATIIRHISLNCCRNRNRLKRSAFICELSSELEQCIPSPNDLECQINDLLFAEMMNHFLSSLTEEKRTIFLRRYCFLDSISDIAKEFGYSESKVKMMLLRIRKRLRDYLIKEGYNL
ncbi:RNA polymerase sigma-54 factor RpoN [Lachnospiraceae bacterium TWA4]|nr:RNA polymerase sigma-54 factor RpoN [Lachnospiraceae bacterium TWA4]